MSGSVITLIATVLCLVTPLLGFCLLAYFLSKWDAERHVHQINLRRWELSRDLDEALQERRVTENFPGL